MGTEDDDKREDAEDLNRRFPVLPQTDDIPDLPKVKVTLPPHPGKPRPGAVKPGGYQKLAIAATAASSFVTPVIVLGVGGYLLDQRVHNQTAWYAFLGTVVGFIAGIFALLRVIQQLSK